MILALLLAASSAGCGQTPPTGGGAGTVKTWTNTVADGDGTSRSFDVEVPSGYSNSTPVSLIFVFHQAGGTSAGAAGWGFATAAGNNAIVVEPQGLLFQGSGPGWDGACVSGGPALPGFSAGTARDVRWVDSLITWATSNYCIDLDRVYAAGFSWGGDFATALACCRGDKFASVAVASATDEFTVAGTSDYTKYLNYVCGAPASVYYTHDASDADVNYPTPDFPTSRTLYRTNLGCSTSFTTSGSCNTYQGCQTGRSFVDCGYTSLGHARPPTWAADVWAYFQGQPRAPSSTQGRPPFGRRAPPRPARPTP